MGRAHVMWRWGWRCGAELSSALYALGVIAACGNIGRPGGLQLGQLMNTAGRDYTIIEKVGAQQPGHNTNGAVRRWY
jgi:hypothetical protein